MSEIHRLFKNTGIIAFGSAGTKLVSFLLLPLYTAVLTTSEYGSVDFATTLVIFCVPASTLLMDEALFRFLIGAKNVKDTCRVISTSFAVVLCGCVMFLIVAVPVAVITKYEYGLWFILYTFSTTALTMMSAFLRGFGRTSPYALMNFLSSTLIIVLSIVFVVVLDWGVVGMLAASVIAQFSVSFSFAVRFKIFSHISIAKVDTKLMRSMVVYSLPLIPNKVSWSIMSFSSRLVIMGFGGASAVGLYALAFKFPSAMDMVYGFFYQAWKESSARVLDSGESESAFYKKVFRGLRRFLVGLFLMMIAFMPALFSVFVNENFHEAIVYVPILLMATYYSNISGFYGGIFTAYKDTRIMGTTTIIGAAINLVLNVILIPVFGLYAAAGSTLIAMAAVTAYRFVKVQRYVIFESSRSESAAMVCSVAIVCCLFYFGHFLGSFFLTGLNCVFASAVFLLFNRKTFKALCKMVAARFGKGAMSR